MAAPKRAGTNLALVHFKRMYSFCKEYSALIIDTAVQSLYDIPVQDAKVLNSFE